MKRFATILLALVMILSLTIGAAAVTITIDPNVTGGTDTNETYNAYKIFTATFKEDVLGENGNVAYTIDSKDNPFFDVIKNFTVEVDGVATPVFKLDPINNSTTYVVTKQQNYDAKVLAAALKAVVDKVTPAATTSVQKDGKYVLDVADKGYYLITSSLGSALVLDTFSDIEIDTKNEYPSLTKTIVDDTARVDSITANYGDTITFEITVKIPATAVGAITVHDTLDEHMTYAGLAEDAVVTKNETACGVDGCNIEFTISAETVAANLENGEVKFQYTATLNPNVATATAHPNTAWLTYSKFTSEKDTVNVYTYKLDVFKYTLNGETETGLAGAGFVLKNEAGEYYKNTDGIVTWVKSIDDATEYKTTDGNYTVTFAGIANGTYTLVEKTIPAGYNGVDDTEVVIENADLTGSTQIKVLNQTGSELPSTGGVGTTMFYLFGGIMVLAAVVLLVTKKRMTNIE